MLRMFGLVSHIRPGGPTYPMPVARALIFTHIFDFAPLAPLRGEGLGVRGFALCFDWDIKSTWDALHC
jgi:hypothetical protein